MSVKILYKVFGEKSTPPMRALQIWQILIGCAHNRRILTYGMLAQMLGYDGSGLLAQPLGYIMNYCQQKDLPALTILVVNQDTGHPTEGLTRADHNTHRETVFKKDWYSIIPPTPEEFEVAHNESQQHALS